MSHRFMLLLLSGAIGVSVTGCANTSPVTRAQSPQAQMTGWEHSVSGASCQNCQNCQANGYCQGNGYCPGNGCYNPNELCNLPCHPVHRNSFTYNTPGGELMYPPSPTPAAITQYPYYTLRGPTDFFMK